MFYEYSCTVKPGTKPEPWAHLRKPREIVPPIRSGVWTADGGRSSVATIAIAFGPGVERANLDIHAQDLTAEGFHQLSAFCAAVAKQLDSQSLA